jgi:hypothetical protein
MDNMDIYILIAVNIYLELLNIYLHPREQESPDIYFETRK